MMKNHQAAKILKSQSGQMSLDFLFGATLILGTGALICALTMALTLVEAIQYVSFSSARAYFSADQTINAQTTAAETHMQALLKNMPFLSGALANGWIKVAPRGAKDFKDYAQTKGATSDNEGQGAGIGQRQQFVGVQLEVALPMLSFNIPFFSSAMRASDDDDVKVTVSSFLMREPTTQECTQFNKGLYQALVNKDPSYREALKSFSAESFVVVNDNGC